jgi:two-component system LytT family response regulator
MPEAADASARARKVTVLIADDEPVARDGLRRMLDAVDWVTCVGEAASGPAAVAAIDTCRPEIVFLDIQMPGLLGTEVLGRVQHQPVVVFTTAYAQHAVTAFELGALDYLLKPFGAERLATALERVRAACSEPHTAPFARFREAMCKGPMSRLFVRTGGSILPVDVAGVAWFEAQGDYVTAHVGASKHVLHVSLQHLEARLDAHRFVRIHRARIVNLDHVSAFRRQADGRLVAVLRDGTRVVVSRNRAKDLRGLSA